ncbi:YeeE/YedE family protein [Paracidovorax wautersii]|uniref:YeeE/YedE family protein n=1 Tax=Paracidovorax wautersii TaxID=1177982 RepID=UPI0031D81E78
MNTNAFLRLGFALLSGLVFGLGLVLSGMTDPAKVLGFLDVAGIWDPSLALVMGGAIAVAAPAFAWLRRRQRSVLGAPLQWPTRTTLDRRLVLGSLAFGAGWGLAGFCPGPALVSAAEGHREAWWFVAAMAAGMAVFSLLEQRRAGRSR